MSQVHCEHCGQAFRVSRIEENRDYFCCAGCALRARVPVDTEGNYPVNADLIGALVLGFLYFNQLLDWGLGSLVAWQGKALLAQRFAFGGAVLGVMVWFGVVLLQRRAGPLRGKDYVVAAISLTLIIASVQSTPLAASLLAAANALGLTWAFRGIARRKEKI